ncbi:MAG: YncE family protein [Flavisolibacter sp.]
MKKNHITCIIAMLLITMSFKAQTQQSFDGDIKNNALAISPNESIAVASYSDSVNVKVYNIKTSKAIKNITGFINPRNIIFSPDGKIFYVTDSGLGLLKAYDAASLKMIKTYPVGYGAFGSAVNKNGDLIFINNEAANTVTVIDRVSKSVKKIITGFAQPRQGVKLNSGNNKLYVTNFANDKITVVDVATLKIDTTISGFNKIRAISISKEGNTLFAANSGTNSIAIVNVITGSIIKQIPVGKDPYGASLSPDETILLSGNKMDNTLSVIDIASLANIKTITGFKEPRQAIVFSKNGKLVYVLNNDLSISIVNLAANKIIRTIPTKQ